MVKKSKGLDSETLKGLSTRDAGSVFMNPPPEELRPQGPIDDSNRDRRPLLSFSDPNTFVDEPQNNSGSKVDYSSIELD